MATPRIPEKVIQQQGVQTLRALGAKVYVSGTRRRREDHQGTMQTPGIPDVEAWLPCPGVPTRRLVKWEVKAAGGRLRPEQVEYQQLCEEANVAHVVGDLDALFAWLIKHHYLTTDNIAHYRRPA